MCVNIKMHLRILRELRELLDVTSLNKVFIILIDIDWCVLFRDLTSYIFSPRLQRIARILV